jgi:hypothetical protein
MVKLELPEFEMVADWVEVCPTVTFPKLRAPGVTLSCPAVTPEPETATVRDVFFEVLPVVFPWPRLVVKDAEPARERVPFAAPFDLGVKVTVRVAD